MRVSMGIVTTIIHLIGEGACFPVVYVDMVNSKVAADKAAKTFIIIWKPTA